MLLWKQRGNKKPAKGINLREMLSRLSRTESEVKPGAVDDRQSATSGLIADPHANQPVGAANGMLAQYFNSSGGSGATAPQTGPSAWIEQEDEFVPDQDAIGPIAQTYAQMQWEAGQRETASAFPSDYAQTPMPASTADQSPQLADEIISGIARKLAVRQYVPKFDVREAFLEETRLAPPASHKYTHGFEPAPRNAIGGALDPSPDHDADWPIAETALPKFSKRRMVLATVGGFGVALATIAVILAVNRTPPSLKETANSDRSATIKPGAPASVERIETVAGVSAVVDGNLSASAARAAASVTSASTFIAGLGNLPATPPVARPPTPALRVDDIAVPAGTSEIALPIAIDAGGGAIDSLKILVADLPDGVSLNRGLRARDGTWTLRPQELNGLLLTLPSTASTAQINVALVSEGVQVARLNPTLTIEAVTDLKVSLGKDDSEEKARGLFEKGEARLGNGDVIGARMFFKKAADAGDAQAANAMGATYDPDLFNTLQVRGMRPDVELARQWYRRAMDLGSKDSMERLEKLKSR